jgi:hypothetical protein
MVDHPGDERAAPGGTAPANSFQQGQLRDHYQPYALDPGNAERLWTLSERLIDSVP